MARTMIDGWLDDDRDDNTPLDLELRLAHVERLYAEACRVEGQAQDEYRALAQRVDVDYAAVCAAQDRMDYARRRSKQWLRQVNALLERLEFAA